MSKLYVFGIGGTGARVIKSLTMLLASGVNCNADAIVPVFVDPDENSGNLTQTITLLKQYRYVRSKLSHNTSGVSKFFKTDIQENIPEYILPLENVSNKQFDDFMGYNTLSNINKAMLSMLFSQDNLKADMQVGFKGNPNIGSVVLNQFADSQQFIDFANSFAPDDQIFIISSIFGGTGASGFPLLLKTLRSTTSLPNCANINNANIGAITVMPYFTVTQDGESAIDSATFTSKTKAALQYYERNISNVNAVDYLYYIGDSASTRNTYQNCEGGISQCNDAHMIELLSALAILDFAGKEKTTRTMHKEFGIKDVEDNVKVIFENLGDSTRSQIQKPMSQFFLFHKYLNEYFSRSDKFPWRTDNGFDSVFWDSQFFKEICSVTKQYNAWLEEMDKNNRSFSPFELHLPSSRLYDFVHGVVPTKMRGVSYWGKHDYNLFDQVLNELTKANRNKSKSREMMFVDIFYDATNKLTTEKLNF